MAYTPELNYQRSCALRRIAWALDVPMTKAIGVIIDHTCEAIDSNKVCKFCRDKTRCQNCVFKEE